MRRKVIKLATNTLVISLPSKWAKQHGIKKGDEVGVEETPNNVIITSDQAARKKSVIVLSEHPEQALRQVNLAYKKGLDEIELQYENPKAYAAAVNELQKLIGFEVVSAGKKHSIVKNIATGEVEDFSTVFRRVFLTVLDIADAAEQYAKKHDDSALDRIKASEINVDRLADFCKRLLNKHGSADIASTTRSYSLLKDLERISDYYVELSNTVVPREFLPALNDTKVLLRNLYELFYRFDETKANIFLDKIKALHNHTVILLKGRQPAAAHYLASIVFLLKEMSWGIYAAV